MRLLILLFDALEAVVMAVARRSLTALRLLLGVGLFAVGWVSIVVTFGDWSASGQSDLSVGTALVGLSVSGLALSGAYWLIAATAPWKPLMRAKPDTPTD